MKGHLHIITHDVPWPADFGGVTDLFYKIKTLHAAGVRVSLHCFTKNRPPQEELKKYCGSVQYYPRQTLTAFFSRLPFIVATRRSNRLIERLNADLSPVLFEGIHCTYPLFSGRLRADKKCFLRLHNVEYKYYGRLAENEKGFWKKIFFRRESRLLQRYEAGIAALLPVFTVSEYDAKLYQNEFGADARFLPVFLPWEEVEIPSGKGSYCLYHGNLSVNENEQAAAWLISKVFQNLPCDLVIAGRAPTVFLKTLAAKYDRVRLIDSPPESEMADLIKNAQVHLLPSFNSTGVKLKLLNALYNGRHCLANSAGVAGSGLADLCHMAELADEFAASVKDLFDREVSFEEIQERTQKLSALYNNPQNEKLLSSWIWTHDPAPDRPRS